MSEKRFVIHDSSVEEYVESVENKNTLWKTKRDVKRLNDFLRGEKREEQELSAITPEDLDRYLAEFIRSVISFYRVTFPFTDFYKRFNFFS